MTLSAITEGEGDSIVAYATVFTSRYLEHGIFYGTLLGAREDVGMTYLATVPHDVFFVGKDDVGHPGALRCDGKVILSV